MLDLIQKNPIDWLGGYQISVFNLAMILVTIFVIIIAYIKMPRKKYCFWTKTGVSYMFGILVFAFGMTSMSFIAFGGSSVGSLAKNGSLAFSGVTPGTISIILGWAMIIVSIIISKSKQDKKMYMGALLTSAVFGLCIDLWSDILIQGLWLGIDEWNVFLKMMVFLILLSIMWSGAPFFYDTVLPKLFGTTFIHALVTNTSLSKKGATIILDVTLTFIAIMFAFIGNLKLDLGTFSFGDVGIGTIMNMAVGGYIFSFWSFKLSPRIKKFLANN